MPTATYNVGAINQGLGTLAQGLYDNARAGEIGATRAMQQGLYQKRAEETAVDIAKKNFELRQMEEDRARVGGLVQSFVDAFSPYIPMREVPEQKVTGMIPAPPINPFKDPSAYNEETGVVASVDPDVPAGGLMPGYGISAPTAKPMVTPEAFAGIVDGLVRGKGAADVPKGIAETFATMLGLTGEERAAHIAHVLQGKGPLNTYQAFTPAGVKAKQAEKLADETDRDALKAAAALERAQLAENGKNTRQVTGIEATDRRFDKALSVRQWEAILRDTTARNGQELRAEAAELERNAKGNRTIPNRPNDVYATHMLIDQYVKGNTGAGEVPPKLTTSIYSTMVRLMEEEGADMQSAITESAKLHGVKDGGTWGGFASGGTAIGTPPAQTGAPKSQTPSPGRTFQPAPAPAPPPLGGSAPAAPSAPNATNAKGNPEIQRGLDILRRLEASNDPDKAAKIAKAKSVLKSLGWSE